MDPERALWSPPPDLPRRRRVAGARLAALLALILALLVAVAALLAGSEILSQLGGLVQVGAGIGANNSTPRPSSSSIPASVGPAASPTFVRPTPTPLPTVLAYVVRRGDTLIAIAKRFGTTARSIAYWNRTAYPSLDPESPRYQPGRIEVGWRLMLIPGAVVDEEDLPSPSPVQPSPSSTTPTTPGPTSAPTPTPAPITIGPAVVIAHGERGTNQIALTFDMGGRLDPAVDIMTLLATRHVHATIFPTGEMGTKTEIGRTALAIVRDHPELFVLANHSWDHPDFTTLSASQMASQLNRTEQALSGLVGRTSRPFVRPPYGAWNRSVRDGVGKAGWHYIVMWDIDTLDWKPTSQGGPTAQDIEATVLANARGGSIVLMHLGGFNTLDALPGILDGLAAKGLHPVTLTEMLGG
jgi:peptidoglycan/xylan/chitin deacetylase (PgdA/CDA1 family)